MAIENTFPIESWGEIFRWFRQIEGVRVDSSAERVDVTIKNRSGILQFSREQLDYALYKFGGNPHEVVSYYLRENGIIAYYQDTLVAYFDIMGYSTFIKKTPIEEAVKKMSDFFEGTSSTSRTNFLGVKLDHWVLSDSVIIVVDTIRHPLYSGSLECFLGTCSMLMEQSMYDGFPLRGAIGGGDFYKDGEVMVSTALVDAAAYEKEQEWLGAVITTKAIQLIEQAKQFEYKLKGETRIDFTSDRFKPFVRYGAIPWKAHERQDLIRPKNSYYIKPFKMAQKDWPNNLPDYFDAQAAQEKINNSHCLYAQE